MPRIFVLAKNADTPFTMFRKLLIILAAAGVSGTALAQTTKLNIPGSAIMRPPANAAQEKIDYKKQGAPLPGFELFDIYNDNITQDVVGTSGNLLLMIFNPVCEHCEEQTRQFVQLDSLFKTSRLLLVAAPVQIPNLSFFEAGTKYSAHTRMITVAIDSAKVLDKLFGYEELPQINIYDGKTHKLIRTFSGSQPIDSLRAYIQ